MPSHHWRTTLLLTVAVSGMAHALSPCGTPKDRIFDSAFGLGPSISASNETQLMLDVVSSGLVDILPDEHSSFLPPAAPGGDYLFFEAARVGKTGAVVLHTNDFVTFGLDSAYASPVFSSPLPFNQCGGANDPGDLEFDENYAAPGSVLQDPTLPDGNLIMIYEGENHCRDGHNVQPYYATAGFARSSDNGVTWPAPAVSPAPGVARYPILGGPDAKPAYDANPTAVGDAIPSGFIDGSCLYVVYAAHPAPGDADGRIAVQIARAQLGDAEPLQFQKFLAGSGGGAFDSPGLGGAGSNVIPYIAAGTPSATPTCTGTQYQPGLSFNNALHRYVMTLVCQVSGQPGQLGWFYSTATSLNLEDWSAPRLIDNTQATATTPCPNNATGTYFDGWYPSFYSPDLAAGYTGSSGIAFYLNGCNLSTDRHFYSRQITVTPDAG